MVNATRGPSKNEDHLVRVRRDNNRSIPPALTRGEQWLRNRAANRTEQTRIVVAREKVQSGHPRTPLRRRGSGRVEP